MSAKPSRLLVFCWRYIVIIDVMIVFSTFLSIVLIFSCPQNFLFMKSVEEEDSGGVKDRRSGNDRTRARCGSLHASENDKVRHHSLPSISRKDGNQRPRKTNARPVPCLSLTNDAAALYFLSLISQIRGRHVYRSVIGWPGRYMCMRVGAPIVFNKGERKQGK